MSPHIEGHASVAITANRGLPVPTEPVGYAKRTPVRSGHVPIKCGTAEGYERHRELGYRPCLMCIKAVESKPTQTPTRQPQQRAECGTVGGYSRHVKKGETTCDPCKEAQRAYRAKMRADRRAAEGKTKRAPFPIAKMLDRRVGLARRDGKVKVIENGKKRRKEVELGLFPAVLEGFHETRTHLGGLFLEVVLGLFEFGLDADKLCLRGLAALGLCF